MCIRDRHTGIKVSLNYFGIIFLLCSFHGSLKAHKVIDVCSEIFESSIVWFVIKTSQVRLSQEDMDHSQILWQLHCKAIVKRNRLSLRFLGGIVII